MEKARPAFDRQDVKRGDTMSLALSEQGAENIVEENVAKFFPFEKHLEKGLRFNNRILSSVLNPKSMFQNKV